MKDQELLNVYSDWSQKGGGKTYHNYTYYNTHYCLLNSTERDSIIKAEREFTEGSRDFYNIITGPHINYILSPSTWEKIFGGGDEDEGGDSKGWLCPLLTENDKFFYDCSQKTNLGDALYYPITVCDSFKDLEKYNTISKNSNRIKREKIKIQKRFNNTRNALYRVRRGVGSLTDIFSIVKFFLNKQLQITPSIYYKLTNVIKNFINKYIIYGRVNVSRFGIIPMIKKYLDKIHKKLTIKKEIDEVKGELGNAKDAGDSERGRELEKELEVLEKKNRLLEEEEEASRQAEPEEGGGLLSGFFSLFKRKGKGGPGKETDQEEAKEEEEQKDRKRVGEIHTGMGPQLFPSGEIGTAIVLRYNIHEVIGGDGRSITTFIDYFMDNFKISNDFALQQRVVNYLQEFKLFFKNNNNLLYDVKVLRVIQQYKEEIRKIKILRRELEAFKGLLKIIYGESGADLDEIIKQYMAKFPESNILNLQGGAAADQKAPLSDPPPPRAAGVVLPEAEREELDIMINDCQVNLSQLLNEYLKSIRKIEESKAYQVGKDGYKVGKGMYDKVAEKLKGARTSWNEALEENKKDGFEGILDRMRYNFRS